MQYIVKSGDTLSKIGAKLGIDWRQLTGYRSGNPSLIYPGEVLTYGTTTPAPISTPTPAPTTPNQSIASSITGPLTKGVYQGPGFQELLPFEKAWGAVSPQVYQTAESIINPFIQRDLAAAQRNVMGNLAQTGGGRFGRGLGQVGSTQAAYERQRKAMLEDMANQYKSGFTNLFYNPTMTAWNQKATALGYQPELPKIPTYDQLKGQYGLT